MRKILNNYGMIFVLLGLCVLFSVLTLKEQSGDGSEAVARMAEQVSGQYGKNDIILSVGATAKDSGPFAVQMGERLRGIGYSRAKTVVGGPRELRVALDEIKAGGGKLAAVIASGDVLKWTVLEQIPANYPEFAGYKILVPKSRLWPDFLKKTNLLAIVDRIVVIAVIAIGMTMVIITAGIDLSVGSLIALSAVVATLVMKKLGGSDAPAWAVPVGFLAGISCCGLLGGLNGFIVAKFKVPSFITTLALMLIARGMAFMTTGGFSIYQVPKTLSWLGHGHSLGVPNTVLLLVILYAAAHVFMSQTRLGRYIYAVGGNEEASRLSGVPVRFVIIFVYIISAVTAGLGGCIQASQLNTGTPNMGVMFELYVIASVVVGGTSLAGGSGRVLGTLIGAFIISVIQNGMNLLGIESYTQQVVLGAVILGAVLLDKIRSGRWSSCKSK
jgi:ribose transport system permease protein